jgi:hypothetical protein
LPGISYYRIKQTDIDGKVSYSPIRQVDLENVGTLRVYPNPATDYVVIEANSKGDIQFSLFNSSGQSISARSKLMADGQVKILLLELNPGIYYLRVTTNNKTEVKKIVVRK